jgi:thymidylate synthase (FAD)
MIEWSGRTCYKSEEKMTTKPDAAEKFVRMIIKNGHHSVLEHCSASFRIICDRGVTHEIVRHRLASYSQESTRYCNYKSGVTFILPLWIQLTRPGQIATHEILSPCDIDHYFSYNHKDYKYKWLLHLLACEASYLQAISAGWKPQQARSVLPNALKTEIVMTCNFREWRHFLKLRCSKKAHPQMQEVANMIKKDLQERIPVVFDDDML